MADGQRQRRAAGTVSRSAGRTGRAAGARQPERGRDRRPDHGGRRSPHGETEQASGTGPESSGALRSGIRGLRQAASGNPSAERLLGEVERHLTVRAQRLVTSSGQRLGEATRRLTDVAEGRAEPGGLFGRTAKQLAQGDSPAAAVGKGVLGRVTDGIKGARGGGSGGRAVTIVEDIDVGVPVRVAYNRWTQFAEFPSWAKGVQTVNQESPTKLGWTAKVAFAKRNWTSTITEQVPDRKIAWKSAGPKGSVDGVVTFHPLARSLTRVLLVLQYHPGGFFEKTANLWRAQGRRARLDLKQFRRFAMLSAEQVEGWRGEIRGGRVVDQQSEPGDSEEPEDEHPEDDDAEDDEDDEDAEDAEDDDDDEDDDDYEEEDDDDDYEEDADYAEDADDEAEDDDAADDYDDDYDYDYDYEEEDDTEEDDTEEDDAEGEDYDEDEPDDEPEDEDEYDDEEAEEAEEEEPEDEAEEDSSRPRGRRSANRSR